MSETEKPPEGTFEIDLSGVVDKFEPFSLTMQHCQDPDQNLPLVTVYEDGVDVTERWVSERTPTGGWQIRRLRDPEK